MQSLPLLSILAKACQQDRRFCFLEQVIPHPIPLQDAVANLEHYKNLQKGPLLANDFENNDPAEKQEHIASSSCSSIVHTNITSMDIVAEQTSQQ